MKKSIIITAFMILCSMSALAQSWSKELEKSAKKGDVASQVAVADAYFKGDGVTANKAKAAKWYYTATIAQNADAKEKLYSFYSKDLEKFAKGGDAQAQYEVGMDYYAGTEVTKNTETAAKWFNLAQAQGHKEAREKFLSYYSKELEKVAKGGDAQAQYEVGMDYYAGTEVTKNTETAAKWFNLAQAQGHKEAQNQLYSYYSKVLENNAKTDTEAMYLVGSYYFDGIKGAPKNEKKGYKYLKGAHENGHPLALEKMASRYTKMLKKDALTWYYSIENADAAYALAKCYIYGRGVGQDKKYAISLLLETMKQGHEKSKALFYSIDSPERAERSLSYSDRVMKVTFFMDYDSVFIENCHTSESSSYHKDPLTQSEKDAIIKLGANIKNCFKVKGLKYILNSIKGGNNTKYKSTYSGDAIICVKKPLGTATSCDIYLCPGGHLSLSKNNESVPVVTFPINNYMTTQTQLSATDENTETINTLSSIAKISIPVQKNVKLTTQTTFRLPLDNNSYEICRKYEFGKSVIETVQYFDGDESLSQFLIAGTDGTKIEHNQSSSYAVAATMSSGDVFKTNYMLNNKGDIIKVSDYNISEILKLSFGINASISSKLKQKSPNGLLVSKTGKETEYINGKSVAAIEKQKQNEAKQKELQLKARQEALRQEREAKKAAEEKKKNEFISQWGETQYNLMEKNNYNPLTRGISKRLLEHLIAKRGGKLEFVSKRASTGSSYFWREGGQNIYQLWFENDKLTTWQSM